jgi:hypothetical protein
MKIMVKLILTNETVFASAHVELETVAGVTAITHCGKTFIFDHLFKPSLEFRFVEKASKSWGDVLR